MTRTTHTWVWMSHESWLEWLIHECEWLIHECEWLIHECGWVMSHDLNDSYISMNDSWVMTRRTHTWVWITHGSWLKWRTHEFEWVMSHDSNYTYAHTWVIVAPKLGWFETRITHAWAQIATQRNTLQHIATCYNTLQHTVTHYNTVSAIATTFVEPAKFPNINLVCLCVHS